MIEIKDVTKRFDKIKAVDHVSFSIREENVFGLIGTNGAGKSTMLRMLAGVLKPDGGMVLVDGMQVYDNVNAKKCFFFIGDEPYFFSTATPPGYGEVLQQRIPLLQQGILLSVPCQLRPGQQAENQYLFQRHEKAACPDLRRLLRHEISVLR